MKRKIIYILIVLAVAAAIGLFANGCASLEKAEPAGGTAQEETTQEGTAPVEGEVAESSAEEATPAVEAKPDTEEEPLRGDEKKTVTITINCDSINNNLERFDPSKIEILPADGLICPPTIVEIQTGDTVFDALLKVTKEKKIHMEYVSTPLYKSNYIEGIGNIYEIDCGPLSGWMYKVNDSFPGYGCGRYILEDGDRIEWIYTCDLGRDIGGDWNEQNE